MKIKDATLSEWLMAIRTRGNNPWDISALIGTLVILALLMWLVNRLFS